MHDVKTFKHYAPWFTDSHYSVSVCGVNVGEDEYNNHLEDIYTCEKCLTHPLYQQDLNTYHVVYEGQFNNFVNYFARGRIPVDDDESSAG
jgi:hypothetical protein